MTCCTGVSSMPATTWTSWPSRWRRTRGPASSGSAPSDPTIRLPDEHPGRATNIPWCDPRRGMFHLWQCSFRTMQSKVIMDSILLVDDKLIAQASRKLQVVAAMVYFAPEYDDELGALGLAPGVMS